MLSELKDFEGCVADCTADIELDTRDISVHQNLAELLIRPGRSAEAEQTAHSAIKLAESTADQAISKYLLAVALKIQGKRTAKVDAELEQLCAGEFETGWLFDGFEDWLKEAEISTEVKDYIIQKTELLKKHEK